jgi:hypothetical protein
MNQVLSKPVPAQVLKHLLGQLGYLELGRRDSMIEEHQVDTLINYIGQARDYGTLKG